MNSTYDQYKEDDFILKSKWKKYEWKKKTFLYSIVRLKLITPLVWNKWFRKIKVLMCPLVVAFLASPPGSRGHRGRDVGIRGPGGGQAPARTAAPEAQGTPGSCRCWALGNNSSGSSRTRVTSRPRASTLPRPARDLDAGGEGSRRVTGTHGQRLPRLT